MTFLAGTDRHPDIDDIRAAANRLQGVAVRTPLLEFDRLNNLAGGRVLLKCEMFQPIGAFKIRGAWNMVSQLPENERKNGVIAYSSGNHAQAVAWSARKMEIPATIVMPADAPKVKIANTRELGANIVLYDRTGKDREAIAAGISDDIGAVIIPPYDHADIIAGQGTIGLEIAEDLEAASVRPDVVAVPCSGGGLIAGCAISLKYAFPGLGIYSAEPEGFEDTARSLARGERVTNPENSQSICDSLLVQTPGELTFDINRKLLSGGVAVSDGDVEAAMRVAFSHTRLVTEPGGAAGLAAVLSKKLDCAGKTTCVVLSGGNADAKLFSRIVSAEPGN